MTPWHCGPQTLDVTYRALVMGIVNVTPDSFSDGGAHDTTAAAVEHALQLAADGADILDIGGESTRPGATPVPLDEELRRVVRVVRELAKRTNIPISIDTMKAEVARRCLDAGACIVNDVTALRGDAAMPGVILKHRPGVVLMHMQGDPTTMQLDPQYTHITAEVAGFFRERIDALCAAGVERNTLCLDPGIGFGKRFGHTMQQLRELNALQSLGLPVCLGVSRKGFLGQVTGRDRTQRSVSSVAVASFAMAQGAAQILRVHDVAATRDAVLLWQAIQQTAPEDAR